MKEKVLVIASVASMIKQFNIPNIKLLIEMGFDVEVACNFTSGAPMPSESVLELQNTLDSLDVKYHQIDFNRNPFNFNSIMTSIEQLKKILKSDSYSFVHCHSPIGGVVTRIACKNINTKVIYTAHGFHFYKGAPILNWFLYYPIEKYFSKYTDILITINKSDYKFAKNHFKHPAVYYLPGVGIDDNFSLETNAYSSDIRKDLNLCDEDFLIVSVGELNKNKNHETIIKAISLLEDKTIHYLICGVGHLDKYLKNLSYDLNIGKNVHLLGFREDVFLINSKSNVFAFPSKREGLGLAAIEAMACGLPIITSNIGGINDYSENLKTGFKCNPTDINCFSRAIESLRSNSDLADEIGERNKLISNKYLTSVVISKTREIYESLNTH